MTDQSSTNTEPKVGDIVVYVGDNQSHPWSRRRVERDEFIVTWVDEGSLVQAIELRSPEHPKWRELDQILVGVESLRVVRRASYTEVQS
jgi:heat shock protein HspQ